jgi:hypothetical protein
MLWHASLFLGLRFFPLLFFLLLVNLVVARTIGPLVSPPTFPVRAHLVLLVSKNLGPLDSGNVLLWKLPHEYKRK